MGGPLIYLKKIDGNNLIDDPWLTHTSLPLKNEWRRLSWPAMKKNLKYSVEHVRFMYCACFFGFPLYPFIAVNLFQKSRFFNGKILLYINSQCAAFSLCCCHMSFFLLSFQSYNHIPIFPNFVNFKHISLFFSFILFYSEGNNLIQHFVLRKGYEVLDGSHLQRSNWIRSKIRGQNSICNDSYSRGTCLSIKN